MRFETVRVRFGWLLLAMGTIWIVATLTRSLLLSFMMVFGCLALGTCALIIYARRPRWAIIQVEITDDLKLDGERVAWAQVRAIERRGLLYGTRWLTLVVHGRRYPLVRCSGVQFPSPYETVEERRFQEIKDRIAAHTSVDVRSF